jgi:hypothetical protein
MTRDGEVCEATTECDPTAEPETTTDRDDRYADVDTDHLDDVEDGCGCAELWEHVSEEREADAGTDARAG